MSELTHIDGSGAAHMVDVSAKDTTVREASATASVRMTAQTLDALVEGNTKKGDVLAAARIAGIMAAKRTADLVPLCHPIPIEKVEVEITPDPALPGVAIETTVRTTGRTGVEMEALCAASVAALTVYDMVKAMDRYMIIENVRVVAKSGGRSGTWNVSD